MDMLGRGLAHFDSTIPHSINRTIVQEDPISTVNFFTDSNTSQKASTKEDLVTTPVRTPARARQLNGKHTNHFRSLYSNAKYCPVPGCLAPPLKKLSNHLLQVPWH